MKFEICLTCKKRHLTFNLRGLDDQKHSNKSARLVPNFPVPITAVLKKNIRVAGHDSADHCLYADGVNNACH